MITLITGVLPFPERAGLASFPQCCTLLSICPKEKFASELEWGDSGSPWTSPREMDVDGTKAQHADPQWLLPGRIQSTITTYPTPLSIPFPGQGQKWGPTHELVLSVSYGGGSE
jgi:hypothetical protein